MKAGPVEVTFPPDAVSTPVDVTIANNCPAPQVLPTQYEAITFYLCLTPHGTTFAKPVTVKLTIDPADLGGFDLADAVALRAENQTDNTWDVVEGIQRNGNTFTLSLTGFSYYVLAKSSGTGTTGDDTTDTTDTTDTADGTGSATDTGIGTGEDTTDGTDTSGTSSDTGADTADTSTDTGTGTGTEADTGTETGTETTTDTGTTEDPCAPKTITCTTPAADWFQISEDDKGWALDLTTTSCSVRGANGAAEGSFFLLSFNEVFNVQASAPWTITGTSSGELYPAENRVTNILRGVGINVAAVDTEGNVVQFTIVSGDVANTVQSITVTPVCDGDTTDTGTDTGTDTDTDTGTGTDAGTDTSPFSADCAPASSDWIEGGTYSSASLYIDTDATTCAVDSTSTSGEYGRRLFTVAWNPGGETFLIKSYLATFKMTLAGDLYYVGDSYVYNIPVAGPVDLAVYDFATQKTFYVTVSVGSEGATIEVVGESAPAR